MDQTTDPARTVTSGSGVERLALYRWWRRTIVAQVSHEAVFTGLLAESGPSARYVFMPMMSAGIAVLVLRFALQRS